MFEPKHKKDRDYNGLTTLRDFWKMVSENFEDVIFGVAGWSKQHIESPVLDHADGSVTEEKLSPEVLAKLNKGGSVPKWALEPEKPPYTAGEVGTYSDNQIDEFLASKADKSDTLAGYGILDAFTKLEAQSLESRIIDVDKMVRKKADKATTLDGYGITDAYTKPEVDQSLAKKTEETVLYEDVVNTPIWTNQPTTTDELSTVFSTDNYYYVTLLSDGQFKLKDFYTDDATVYEPVFTLIGYNTGNSGILEENAPVEFTSDYQLRTAGVSMVKIPLNKNFNTDVNKLTVRVNGRFVKTAGNSYLGITITTNKNISNYHSGTATTWNDDSGKNIWHSVGLQAETYKDGKYSDMLYVERFGENQFHSRREVLLRTETYGTTTKKNTTYQTIGFGELLNADTMLNSVFVYAPITGYIRNGTVIDITEVK